MQFSGDTAVPEKAWPPHINWGIGYDSIILIMVCIPDFGQISARRTVQTAVAGTVSGYGKDLPGK